MSLYVDAISFGSDFITHSDKEKGTITGYPGNIWVVADNMGAWVGRVGGMRVTKSVAQATVDVAVNVEKAVWASLDDALKSPPTIGSHNFEPVDITLP